MVITRQQNATEEANPSVTKFSKEQNGGVFDFAENSQGVILLTLIIALSDRS